MRSIGCVTTLGALTLLLAPAADAAGHGAASAAAALQTRQHSGPDFDWPLRGDPPVTHQFDPPANDYGRGHRGTDLAAEPDQAVLAAAAGTVVYAGRLAGRGVVSIRHTGGLRSTYEPVDSEVSTGERVRQGQVIGSVSTGHRDCPAPACLHWGLRNDSEYLDPLVLVRDDVTIELKPWKQSQ